MGVKTNALLVNFWCDRELMGFFDALCQGRGWSRSFGLRELIRRETGLEIMKERSVMPRMVVPADQVHALLQGPAGADPDEEITIPIINNLPPLGEVDFYGKPLPPGYTRIPGTWWAEHPRRPRLWIGEKDASGEPIFEEF